MAASELAVQIGRLIREHRQRLALTQAKLADMADVDPKYPSALEHGQKNITVGNLEKLIRALGLQPRDLFATKLTKAPSPEHPEEMGLLGLLRKSDPRARAIVVEVAKCTAKALRRHR